jgi:hypothetical protein
MNLGVLEIKTFQAGSMLDSRPKNCDDHFGYVTEHCLNSEADSLMTLSS